MSGPDCALVSASFKHLLGTSLKSCALTRGIQREYSSKPLNHSIVKRILVFHAGRYRHIFINKKFFICSDFRQKKGSRKF